MKKSHQGTAGRLLIWFCRISVEKLAKVIMPIFSQPTNKIVPPVSSLAGNPRKLNDGRRIPDLLALIAAT